MISSDRLQQALTYLAETDEPAANAKGRLEGLQYQLKTIKALAYQESDGKTVSERENDAFSSSEYKGHCSKIHDAVVDFETLRNKRITESLIVEVWRSMNANRRYGNV